ncbi:MAG: class I SAM-dependent methyltransferase [Planctomycetes bacterium]|nr:class I SAM-dependent methyltransferase [Planctomycetota bacterium]
MSTGPRTDSPSPDELGAHYAGGYEARRTETGYGKMERERSMEILLRHLPRPPAVVLDVGGGPGVYACWLARLGYPVHLIDPVPLHVEHARRASSAQPSHPVRTVEVGDARSLPWKDGGADAAILFGPLYHLTERTDRVRALKEALRVLRPGGVLFAAAVSRFASTFDGVFRGFLDDPAFERIAERDRRDGQHRNPTGNPAYFMDTFFHHPDELKAEVAEAGFRVRAVYGVEGPGWLLQDFDRHWNDEGRRLRLLEAARAVETEPSLLGMSAHILAVAGRG